MPTRFTRASWPTDSLPGRMAPGRTASPPPAMNRCTWHSTSRTCRSGETGGVEWNPDDGLVRTACAVSELVEIVRHVQQQTEDTAN